MCVGVCTHLTYVTVYTYTNKQKFLKKSKKQQQEKALGGVRYKQKTCCFFKCQAKYEKSLNTEEALKALKKNTHVWWLINSSPSAVLISITNACTQIQGR